MNTDRVSFDDGPPARFLVDSSESWTAIDARARAEMASEARGFIQAQRRLLQEVKDQDGLPENFPTPAIVLGALAAEIALKALVARDNGITQQAELRKFFRGPRSGPDLSHDLEYLYSSTSPKTRTTVRRECLVELNCCDFAYYLTRGEFLNSSEFNTMSFEFLLRDHSKSFVDWRYVYEPGTLQAAPAFLASLATAAIYALNEPAP